VWLNIFSEIRRKAAASILREIRAEYVMPLGVWQIREGIRKALDEEAEQFENFKRALSFACFDLSISQHECTRNSEIHKNMKEQMRITDFFKGQF
jgi:hypothetical protein